MIPKYPVRMHVGEDKDELLILEGYPGTGTYVHYQDNGEDFRYRQGAYNEYCITNQNGEVKIEKIHEGYLPYQNVEVRSGEQLWPR